MSERRTNRTQRAGQIILASFLTLVIGVANGQPYDFGVQTSTDEFTGDRTCYHRVDNGPYDDSGITLTQDMSGDLGTIVWIRRDFDYDPNTWTFNSMDTSPRGNDRVYIRWPDGTVDELRPDFVSVDTQYDVETAAWWQAEDLARRLTTTRGEIRVRFAGWDGNRDFTIEGGVLHILGMHFFQICLR